MKTKYQPDYRFVQGCVCKKCGSWRRKVSRWAVCSRCGARGAQRDTNSGVVTSDIDEDVVIRLKWKPSDPLPFKWYDPYTWESAQEDRGNWVFNGIGPVETGRAESPVIPSPIGKEVTEENCEPIEISPKPQVFGIGNGLGFGS